MKKMASVYELARALGEGLLETTEVKNLLQAKEVYEADTEIVKEVEEYTKRQQEFEQKFSAGQTTQEENDAFRDDMIKRGDLIKGNKAASALFAAEMQFNNLMQSVFSMVTSIVAGEEENAGGCSGSSCSSCGGGCGH